MRRLLCLIAFLVVTTTTHAHELRPAFLQINQIAPEEFTILWKVPARGGRSLPLNVVLPKNCSDMGPQTAREDGGSFIVRWVAHCENGLTGETISISGLRATFTDALARVERSDGTVQTARITTDLPHFVVAGSPSWFDTAQTYFLLGVEHILLGFDHLLFVLALLLLIRDLRRLVETITAFTVAHSFTLAAAALQLTRVPQPPVEAVIALSIAVIAAEVVRAERGELDLSIRYPWLIAFAFGLLHGFGFGGALREIGLPQNDVPIALLTFNLGVEAGQLFFVGAVLLTSSLLRRIVPIERVPARTLVSYAIGCTAAFWFAERVANIIA